MLARQLRPLYRVVVIVGKISTIDILIGEIFIKILIWIGLYIYDDSTKLCLVAVTVMVHREIAIKK